MSLSSSHQSHMNITEARKHAVRLMTRETGVSYYLNGDKVTKAYSMRMIKRGFFDGFTYAVNFLDKEVRICSNDIYLHKIGN